MMFFNYLFSTNILFSFLEFYLNSTTERTAPHSPRIVGG